MAEDVQIQGSNEPGKIRNPLGVIGLTLITFGIYGIVWYYKMNKELAEIGKARNTEECGTAPGTSVLAVTLGAFVIVPAIMSMYNFCKRLNAAERLTGAPQGVEPGLLFVVFLFVSPVGFYLAQSSMNKVLGAQSGAAPAMAAPAPAEMPAAVAQPQA